MVLSLSVTTIKGVPRPTSLILLLLLLSSMVLQLVFHFVKKTGMRTELSYLEIIPRSMVAPATRQESPSGMYDALFMRFIVLSLNRLNILNPS